MRKKAFFPAFSEYCRCASDPRLKRAEKRPGKGDIQEKRPDSLNPHWLHPQLRQPNFEDLSCFVSLGTETTQISLVARPARCRRDVRRDSNHTPPKSLAIRNSFLRSSDAKCAQIGLSLWFGLRCKRQRCQIASDVGLAMRTTKNLTKTPNHFSMPNHQANPKTKSE